MRPHDVRLAALWSIVQSLCATPWPTDHRELNLWDRCLSAWNKSAAWYGQHGLQYAGALAADNSLMAIRVLSATAGEQMSLAEVIRRGESHVGNPSAHATGLRTAATWRYALVGHGDEVHRSDISWCGVSMVPSVGPSIDCGIRRNEKCFRA